MNNKKIVIGVFLFVILIAGVFLQKKFSIFTGAFQYNVRGSVLEVKDNSVVVQGFIKSTRPNSKEESKTLELFFTPETNYKAIVLIMPKIRPSGPFTPEEKKGSGSKADLQKGISIYSSVSQSIFKGGILYVDDIEYHNIETNEK